MPHLRTRQRYSRRRFLQIGSSGLLGVGLADLLRAESTLPVHRARATSLILIWLGGGPSTIDMWDPKPEAAREIRGEFGTIPTSLPGVQFSEHMPRTAECLDRCVLVRSLHHNVPDHVPGAQYLMTGNKPNASLEYPSIGSLAARLLPTCAGMPAYFTIGEAANTGAGFLGAAYDPFRVASTTSDASNDLNGVVLPAGMTLEQLEERRRFRDIFSAHFLQRHAEADLVGTLSKFQQDAYEILASNRIGKAFDLTTEPDSIRRIYGDDELGRNTLIARRLVEAGARFVTVATDGWDTHTGNFATLRSLLPPLDHALAGLVVDLEQRGMLHDTLVVCGGEFGRTPRVNATGGRDHWSRAMTFFMSGGGLKNGCVYGSSDARGFDPVDLACSPDDLGATLFTLLGFPAGFPVHTTAGRPVELFKNGVALADMIG